jgi:hypothetical protein
MRKHHGLFLVPLAAHLLTGAPLLDHDYTASADLLPEETSSGISRPAMGEGAFCLELDGSSRNLPLATVAVVPNTKYRLTLRARVQGAFTVEQNDRAHIEAIMRRGRTESGYQVRLLTGDDPAGTSGGGGFILTRDWYDYVHVFRVPADVLQATIRLEPRGHVTQIARVTLETADENGAININPDFRYGELNYCGWSPQRDGRLYQRPDERCVFRSGYGGSSPRFPLQTGRFYRMTARGQGGHLNIHYYDADGKSIASRFLLRPSETDEAAAELTPPDGCVSARVVMYGTVLESFKVVERDPAP